MKDLFMKLNLQFFAEVEPPAPAADPIDQPAPADPPAEKTFTQTELEKIIADRLAREKQKTQQKLDEAAAEAERKRLEEQSEFKTLYENAQAELAATKAAAAAAALATKKQELIIAAGYAADQLQDISALVTGATEDEIAESFERIKKLVPVKQQHADPQLGGSQRQGTLPKTKDAYETARERARSLLKRK